MNDYLQRLEATLGTDGFEAVYRELENDSSVDAAAMRTIAQTFTNCRYRDARTRSLALGAIWSRYDSLKGAKFRADAIGRRLAG
jgi:hypothetical protein